MQVSVYQYCMTTFGGIVNLAGPFGMNHNSISLATIEGCLEGRDWKGKPRKGQRHVRYAKGDLLFGSSVSARLLY